MKILNVLVFIVIATLVAVALIVDPPTRPAGAIPLVFPENPGGGGGVTAPGSSYGIPSRVGLQDAITYYHWQTAPATTVGGTSWVVKNSITNAYTYRVDGPWLSAVPIGGNPGVQSLCYERAIGASGVEIYSGQGAGSTPAATDRRRILFDWQFDPNDGWTSGSNGLFQFMYGDTTCLLRQKIPRGFGVAVMSNGRCFGGIQAGVLTAFVGNGSDTTYTPLNFVADAGVPGCKIYMDAHSGGVDFYVNDVYQTTITSPTRAYTNTAGMQPGCAWWNEGSDTDDISVSIGFLTVQREWSP